MFSYYEGRINLKRAVFAFKFRYDAVANVLKLLVKCED